MELSIGFPEMMLENFFPPRRGRGRMRARREKMRRIFSFSAVKCPIGRKNTRFSCTIRGNHLTNLLFQGTIKGKHLEISL